MTTDIGNLARITGTWTNLAGTEVDPDAVLFRYQDPSGVITTYEYPTDAQLIKESVGVYYVDIDIDEPGWWYYRFWSTGAGQAAKEGRLKILPKRL